MLEVAFVLAPGQNLFFLELQQALAAELDEIGIATSLHWGDFPEPRRGLVYVVMPPHEYFTLMHGRIGPPQSVFDRTMFISAEQPDTSFFEWNVAFAGQAGALFDINRLAVRAYADIGIVAEHLQMGHTAGWDHRAPEAEVRRDIDVLFMGAASDRRLRHLASYARTLRNWNCHWLISDNSLPNHRASGSFFVEEDKWDLLRRSKVILNIHQNETPYFEWLRIVQAMANGCVVVSEESLDIEPMVPGQHLAIGRPEALGHLALHLLLDDETRCRMQETGYRLVRDELPLADAAVKLAAAARRLDERPVPSGDTGFFLQPRVREADADAALRRLMPSVEPDPLGLRRALKAMRLDLLDIRRALDIAVRGQSSSAVAAVRVHRRSRGFVAAKPRVSVLMTVYNYAHHVTGALDSLLASRERSWEVIIVDDGSRDRSLETADAWIDRYPDVASLLVAHPVNRGLAHARNTALAFARGEMCFVLDADNEIYPWTFERLLALLEHDPEAAFAYGMLERFTEAGPVGLASIYPWAPERFRSGNYIDAMAMLRTRTLRDFGGYRTDPRLYGWEDFDLWCRLAEAGRHGRHLPSVVARYRTSEHSMLSITNISGADATSVIAEASPRIMADAVIPA